jgi:prepilin-type N-terminal cleavage/methylation domain-containing protein
MYITKLRQIGQRGDTIVEVMIVLAVLGMAISICYATATKSLSDARQAQENSEASSLVQSQVEALRVLAPYGPSATADKNIFRANFCVINTAGVYSVVDSTDVNCNNQGSVPYQLSVSYQADIDDTFIATATWPNVRGEGNDSVTTVYRVHKP